MAKDTLRFYLYVIVRGVASKKNIKNYNTGGKFLC